MSRSKAKDNTPLILYSSDDRVWLDESIEELEQKIAPDGGETVLPL